MIAQAVRAEQRHTKSHRCPICGGCDGDVRGKGRRCHGFTSDGWAHCSREEHAGGIFAGDKSGTYAHKLTGPCACGTTHGTDEQQWRDIEAAYDYRDERGSLLFQVVRKMGKQFLQRRPDGEGGWDWKTSGMRRVLYRLPDLLAADMSQFVFIVEGEKDVENLRARGAVATCNPMGAGKWAFVVEHAREALADRNVVALCDADEVGRKHAKEIAASLIGIARSIRIVDLFPGDDSKRDVSDWLEAGHDLAELTLLATVAPTLYEKAPAELPAQNPAAGTFHRGPDLVPMILARAGEEFISHRVGDTELYRLRLGGVAILTGAPGTGKTSLATNIGIEHARWRGPLVFVSLEMDADELGARAVGMLCDASWEDALSGRVPREDMERALDLPRLFVLDGDHATLTELEKLVERLRSEYPGEPVLVVLDYLQIVPGDDKDTRSRVAAAAQAVRRMAKRLRVVVLAISQPSRAAGRALSTGELLGADTMTAMAESAEIERSAYITLALGSAGPVRDDGTASVDLSIGKGRMGGGDRVIPMAFNGRTGRMRTAGESRSAAEVKAERQGRKDEVQLRAKTLAISALLTQSPEPMSRRDIRAQVGGTDALVRSAVQSLLDDHTSGVVEVGPRKHGAYSVWMRAHAEASDRPIVPRLAPASDCIGLHRDRIDDAHDTASRALVGRDADAVENEDSEPDAVDALLNWGAS